MDEQGTKLITPGAWSVVFDDNGTISDAFYSDSFRTILGYESEEEYANANESWLDVIHPDDVKRVEAHEAEVFEKHPEGMDFDIEYRMMTKRGYRWFHDCAYVTRREDGSPIRANGAVFDIQDVLDKQTAQKQLVDVGRTMKMITSLASEFDPIFVLDPISGGYDWYQSKAEEIEELTAMSVHGTDFYKDIGVDTATIIHEDDRPQFEAFYSKENMLRIAETGEVQETENRWRVGPNDTYLWKYNKVVRMIDESGKVYVVVGVIDTTEAKKRESEIRVQSELADQQRHLKVFGDLVNAAPWVLDITGSDEILRIDCSPELRRMFGFEDEEDSPNVLAAWLERLHPEDKERVQGHFRSSIRNRAEGLAFDIEYRMVRKDGGYRWHHALGRTESIDEDMRRLFGIVIDITAEKQLEEQLSLSDGLAREYHTVWLVEGSGEHRLHLFRSTGQKTVQRALQLGLDEPTYDGTMVKYVMDSVHEDDRERVLEASKFETVVRETPDIGTYVVSYRRYCDDEGGIDYHQMCFAKAVAENGTMNYILAFRDADKMLREQIAQQKRLEEALSMAESASRAKTTFLNNMSHDIRTPMNAIIGFTGLAASHIDNIEQVLDYLGKIEQSSNHLLSLINDVLDMSRIESGKMNMNECKESLPEIIQTLHNIVMPEIRSRHQTFFIDTLDVNDEEIICDKLRLNQILLNVLSNSIKYTAAGGTISMRIIEKAIKPSGYATFEFRIKDNGMGMDEEYLKTIFEPFTRVDSSTVSGIQGTGLGMAITKNIIDMMGGRIAIESELGVGTETRVTLDFKLASRHKEPSVIPELLGKRGLVVDDDSNTCLSISNMLRDTGLRAEWCMSGREAVIRASEGKTIADPFNIYVIDWVMPEMNGVETTRRIRSEVGDEPPIIVLTTYDWSDIEEEARAAGVTAFASKPLFPSGLHRVLNDCLGKVEEAEEAETEEYDFSGKRVLLVEDNELNREIAQELLEEYGFVVETAVDGSVAVARMQDHANNGESDYFDCILMDIQMPQMDGYEATRRIRAIPRPAGSRLPIIAMTANAFEEDRKAAFEAGMDEHIAKPIDIEALKSTLARFL